MKNLLMVLMILIIISCEQKKEKFVKHSHSTIEHSKDTIKYLKKYKCRNGNYKKH